ncbi:uncharacterized protein LOC131015092 isoform X2 [Salvia miltiorrhiza]|uniref:uncharacterized protein LOC131015092 isoform X2 n=1 Tax=Salvia miltiorrhiza TaxID=226208 RepID=UPI0025AC6668|nr:uncharacterized protein LOC131015092 isoform X2 [Salvia miltiorrhiza]
MEHNQAVDGLLNLFSKANRDLSAVQHKLHKEFQQTYPENTNPMKLVERLKKIEEEMSSLKDECRELLACKTVFDMQDLIDKARTLLVGNRTMLHRLQVSTGVPLTGDADGDDAYESFNQVIDEWATQVKSTKEDEEEPGSNDINQMLFSAIVQSN